MVLHGKGGWLEDLGGRFDAKLREVTTQTRLTADGKTPTTFKLARVEAAYDPDVVQKLAPGQLLAIPNVKNLSSDMTYSVFEIADIAPMHYSMLTLNTSQPGALREEFMGLIEKEWRHNSKSTWVDITASPTGYVVDFTDDVKYERRYSPLLVGSEVKLLNKEAVRRFVCYVSGEDDGKDEQKYSIGNLLGVIDESVLFTVNFAQLINYHVGVFCHTGGGKSYLTSMVVRKALAAIPDLKVVVFDVSSEYAIHLLDELASHPSRVVYPELDEEEEYPAKRRADEFYKKHVIPEALESKGKELKPLAEKLFEDGKIKSIYVKPDYLAQVEHFRTYEGLLESLGQTVQEKYGANQQASLYAIDRIRIFLKDSKKRAGEAIDKDALPMIEDIMQYFKSAGVRTNSTVYGLISALQERLNRGQEEPEELGYTLDSLVLELLDSAKSSPRLFIIDDEIERSRDIAARLIDEVFKKRRSSFNLHPRILFVFDEAQEFAPNDSSYKAQEGTAESSRAVEKLLRHGRKYHLNGWISTQRLAHLNTSALHQIHSYFVGTLPRPYDRQLVGDTFAIDDALLERTLNFAPGDWMITSYRATSTQNVPVFFHAINNEELIVPK